MEKSKICKEMEKSKIHEEMEKKEKLDIWESAFPVNIFSADFINQVSEYYWGYVLRKYPEEVANEKPNNLSSKEWYDKLASYPTVTPVEAAAEGLLETLKYLKDCGTGIDIEVLVKAAFNGHQQMLEYLLESYSIFNPDLAYIAAAYGDRVNILEWMNNKGLGSGIDLVDEAVLAYFGNLETLKYILNMHGPGISSRIATYALLGNSLPVLRWAASSGVFPDMNLYNKIKETAVYDMRSNLKKIGLGVDIPDRECYYVSPDVFEWMKTNNINFLSTINR